MPRKAPTIFLKVALHATEAELLTWAQLNLIRFPAVGMQQPRARAVLRCSLSLSLLVHSVCSFMAKVSRNASGRAAARGSRCSLQLLALLELRSVGSNSSSDSFASCAASSRRPGRVTAEGLRCLCDRKNPLRALRLICRPETVLFPRFDDEDSAFVPDSPNAGVWNAPESSERTSSRTRVPNRICLCSNRALLPPPEYRDATAFFQHTLQQRLHEKL